MTHPVDKTGDWKSRLYDLGFELFNRGERFEAHEEWEAMWLEEPKGHPNRLFLQGLIQIAAAFHRVETGFPRAAYRLFRSARRKLMPYAPSYKGVDVAALVPLLETWMERMLAVSEKKTVAPLEPFPIPAGGRRWREPERADEGTPESKAMAKAFEQYSSDREVRSECPKCGATLTVNGRRRAPERELEREWRVWCPRACISRVYAGAAR